ncbi:MAG: type II toxin-antitoxin system VapB family antitoxin [Planctomycetota bacterium]|nr:type II toxin-antitoxin system VapB family antitoxin [Planctomycetota bacterium]
MSRLPNEPKRVGRCGTKNETVVPIPREQRKILKAMGTFEFRKDWDYKKDRGGQRSGI